MIDDEKNIKSCLNGSHEAFGLLVDKYKSFVCSIAYCTIGSIHASEDISQEVFISAWKNLPKLKDTNKFPSWLGAITRNAVKCHLRKESATPRIVALGEHQTDITSNASQASTDENSVLWQTLEDLPVEYRETLTLYYRHDKSTKQVAALLEITPDAVRQRLSRGREMMRVRMEDKLEAGLRSSAPGKKFTTSVLAAISSIPVGIAMSEAAVSTAAVSPIAAISSVLTATAAKVAIVLVAAVAITAGLILNNKQPEQPQIAPQQTEITINTPTTSTTAVETYYNTSPNQTTPKTKITPAPPQPTTTTISHEQQQQQQQPNPESPAGFTPKGVLSGLITDKKTGEPVIDAQLHLQLPDGHYANTETDEFGFYYFDEDKIKSYGNYNLTIVSTEYVGIHGSIGNSINMNIVPKTNAIQHIQLDKACMLSIEATDEEGNPISKVEAIVTEITSTDFSPYPLNRAHKRTDKKGKMIIGGIPSSPTPRLITLIHSESKKIKENHYISVNQHAPAHQTLIMNDPDIIESIKVVLKKGVKIQGQLFYADGIPANDLKISVEPQWWDCAKTYSNCDINENSTFSLEHIEPGMYDIMVSVPLGIGMWQPRKLSTESLEEGKSLNLTLPYNRPSGFATFKGKIIFEGDCITTINMIVRNGDNLFQKHLKYNDKNEEISFEFNDIPSGNYTVDFLTANIKESQFNNISIPSDDYIFKLQCKETINISGIVLDKETQNPITDFRVFHRIVKSKSNRYSGDNKWVNYQNSDKGKYEITVSDEGVHQFIIDSDNYAPQIIELNITSDDTSFVANLTKGTTLKGNVIDNNGQPVKNAKIIPFSKNAVYARDNKRNVFIAEIASAISNEKGDFVLKNLPVKSETMYPFTRF